MERETGLEPATSTLARLHSTTELLPLDGAQMLADFFPACQAAAALRDSHAARHGGGAGASCPGRDKKAQ